MARRVRFNGNLYVKNHVGVRLLGHRAGNQSLMFAQSTYQTLECGYLEGTFVTVGSRSKHIRWLKS